MQVTYQNDAPVITAANYRLDTAADRPYVYLFDSAGERICELFVLSSVHTLQGRDDTNRIGTWQVKEQADSIVLELSAESSLWRHKIYRFRCYAERLAYEIEVEGQGNLTEAVYFGGYYSGQLRWGSGFFWSGQYFKRGFNPEPVISEVYTFDASGGSVIDLLGVPLPGKTGWFYTPPPFCFALEMASGWMSMGIEAAPGMNHYSDYHYRGQQEAFCLALNYEGYTRIEGTYQLPSVGIDFAPDEYEVLNKHTDALRAQGYAPSVLAKDKPAWWYEPIYCGWGSQCYSASLEKGHAPNYARQELYEGFTKALNDHEIAPGVVVLDDKWQATYGDNQVDEDKWPDIYGFIESQHAAGRKVLLWLKAWDAEGVSLEECVTNATGLAITVDPTNPAFEQRFRRAIRQMLSPQGYNADGFKIDFTARIPSGPGLKLYEPVWGLELMKRYLSIIYDEAKRVKPDALIMAHTPHPYLDDVVDMIRLNDINTGRDVNRAMTHRARIAALACPNAIIDTDNWPITDKVTWRDYVRLQPQLGLPSLYYATHIDSTGEPLTDEDYALIRETWAAYRSSRD